MQLKMCCQLEMLPREQLGAAIGPDLSVFWCNCCLSQISRMLRPSGSECTSTREANLVSVAKMSQKGLTRLLGTDLLSVTHEERQGRHVCYSSFISLCQLWGAVSVMLSSRKALHSAKQFSLLEQFHETEGVELPSVICLKVEHRLSCLWERCTCQTLK